MGLTTDRTSECLNDILPNGQQKCYLVLSEDERSKGFVRPVRHVYKHLKCGVETRMGDALAETYARDNSFYNGTYCVGCGKHFPLVERMFNPDHPSGVTQVWDMRQFEWIVDGKPSGSFVGE